MENRHQQSKSWGAGVIIFLSAALLVHSRYSFCQTDEPLYVAFLHRLYLGEALIADEWWPAQLYSPVLYPIYLIYKLVIPSGDGVLLFFRILNNLLATVLSIFLFYFLEKRYSELLSLGAALICLFYSRGNIPGCSYYSICFRFILLSLLIVFSACNKAPNFITVLEMFCAGLCLFIAILGNPYEAVFLPIIILLFIIKRKRKQKILITSFIIGVVASCFVYIIFILERASLRELIVNLKYMMLTDVHQETIANYYNQIKIQSVGLIRSNYFLFILLVLSIIFLKKKRIKFYVYIAYCCMIILFCSWSLFHSSTGICFGITYPFTLILFPLALNRMKVGEKEFPIFLYFIGLFTALAWFFASTTGLDAMTGGFTLSSISGCLLLSDSNKSNIDIRNNLRKEIFLKFTPVFFCVMLLIPFFCHRFFGIYRDAPLKNLTVQLNKGPAAGLLTTPEHAEEYYSILKTIHDVHSSYPKGQVVFSKTLPWTYLAADWGYGSPSAWRNDFSEERYKTYYGLHPDKIPSLIFIFRPEAGGWKTAPFNNHMGTYTYNKIDIPVWVEETFLHNAVVLQETPFVKVYSVR